MHLDSELTRADSELLLANRLRWKVANSLIQRCSALFIMASQLSLRHEEFAVKPKLLSAAKSKLIPRDFYVSYRVLFEDPLRFTWYHLQID
jgi:hypothetical protein